MKKYSLVFLLFLIATTSCLIPIKGEGPVVSTTIALDNFDRIQLKGSMNVELIQGSELQVIVEGEQNIIDRLKRDVSNSTWKIALQNGNYTNYSLKVIITAPDIKEVINDGSGWIDIQNFTMSKVDLEINGSGNITTDELTTSDLAELRIDGSGDITIKDLVCPQLKSTIDGSGNITVQESDNETDMSNYDVRIDGSGNVNTNVLSSTNVNVEVNGSGDTYVWPTSQLTVRIDGSGNVYYKGTPQITQTIDGSGNLINQ